MNKDVQEYVGKDMNGYKIQKPIGTFKLKHFYIQNIKHFTISSSPKKKLTK